MLQSHLHLQGKRTPSVITTGFPVHMEDPAPPPSLATLCCLLLIGCLGISILVLYCWRMPLQLGNALMVCYAGFQDVVHSKCRQELELINLQVQQYNQLTTP